ncbi:hypothetical protein DCE93_06895 [Agromyces badenianii]|uniref:Bacterial Ig-like domain-containing protein n=1 Tax=Agromyces badenianii TaxID=2080742 RepID=A0A2S0WVU2_9MICO|nr:Ig-like domain-containing protein [Agromyces badenianii]AWB95418.1 hypothetical protein DCE93_06895 [Agromyces badenianii]
MPTTRPRRIRSAMLAAALSTFVAASALSFAAPASAAELVPENEINGGAYTLTLDPATRSGVSQGSSALVSGPSTVTTDIGCPEGYRRSSRTFIVHPDGTEKAGAVMRANMTAAAWGLQGNAITLVVNRASNWFNDTLTDGLNAFVVTCDAPTEDGGFVPNNAPIGDSKYFVAYLQVDRAAQSWTVVPKPVEKADTTASLTPTAGNDGSVTLTATVSPAAATGSVSFVNTATGTEIGTGTLTAGSASTTVTGLAAGTSHSFKAVYAGDDDHNGSESGVATVNTVAEPQPPQNTAITVTIPASATGLKFTVTPGAVALSAATLNGTSYVATGTLEQAKVSDNREVRTAWALNGSASEFVNTTDNTKKIAASSLGWKPELIGGAAANGGTAGAEIAAGANGGLSSQKSLAQAAAGATVANTTVKAGITLKAPADTAAGDYTSTLTITLI